MLNPVRIRVLFFGILRERFGLEQDLVVAEGSVAGDVLRSFRDAAPQLAELWPSVAVAVNQQYASAATVLYEGDEVALLPPVSGGSPAFYTRLFCSKTCK